MPEDLLEAMERGVLTDDQLRQLITVEAGQLGMTFDGAREAARHGELPSSPLGLDILALLHMLG